MSTEIMTTSAEAWEIASLSARLAEVEAYLHLDEKRARVAGSLRQKVPRPAFGITPMPPAR